MSNRITLISLIDKIEMNKINDLFDYNKVLNLQKILKEKFNPFFLEFYTLALYDYPGEIIKKINLDKE